jgi:hypothetical protein
MLNLDLRGSEHPFGIRDVLANLFPNDNCQHLLVNVDARNAMYYRVHISSSRVVHSRGPVYDNRSPSQALLIDLSRQEASLIHSLHGPRSNTITASQYPVSRQPLLPQTTCVHFHHISYAGFNLTAIAKRKPPARNTYTIENFYAAIGAGCI